MGKTQSEISLRSSIDERTYIVKAAYHIGKCILFKLGYWIGKLFKLDRFW